ncbi:hypothetical protein DIZ27_43505 [Streptomyces sp. NWU339]|nr:FAD-dependent monooxygenase [Streptomyces sp. NWU339]PWI04735.1 hypothetical protein DIZ27_43505 [Streptomyces sp. NWU339]
MPPSPQVLIAGAGPAGLALAAELAGFGVSCQVVDKRTGRSRLSPAGTVEPRTLELLDMRGRVGDVLAWGRECPHPPLGNEDGYLDYGLLDTPFPFSLSIPQARTEDALQAAAEKAGAVLLFGTEMTGLSQDDDGVDVELTGPEGPATVRARYVVGCDGVNSTVHDAIGVEFDGWNYDQSLMMADARLSSPPGPAEYARITRRGMAALFPFRDGTYRVIVLDREKFAVPADEPLTLEDLSESCAAILGSDIGMHNPLWLSRFRSSQRHAKTYRAGRVLLAGDAAHTHIPSGGQGLQTGIQDAFNLGWKLRAVLDGWALQGLLDSYEAERYPNPADKRDRWTGRRIPDRPLVVTPRRPGTAVRVVPERSFRADRHGGLSARRRGLGGPAAYGCARRTPRRPVARACAAPAGRIRGLGGRRARPRVDEGAASLVR